MHGTTRTLPVTEKKGNGVFLGTRPPPDADSAAGTEYALIFSTKGTTKRHDVALPLPERALTRTSLPPVEPLSVG